MTERNLQEEAYIRAAVKAHFSLEPIACDPVGEGGAGLVYKVDFAGEHPPVCVKKYTSVGLGERQKADMERLGRYSAIPFPKVYFVHNETKELPLNLLCMEYLPGVSAFDKRFYWRSKKKRRAMAQQVVDSLLRIHAVKNDRFGEIENPQFDTWNAYYRPKAQSILKQAELDAAQGRFSRKVLAMMRTAFAAYDTIFEEDVTTATLIHGDFFVANLLIDPKTLAPVAIIDPFNSMWADVEYELFALNNVMGSCFQLYETYAKKATLSEKCDLKCAFYALFAEVQWYQLYGSKNDVFIDGLVKKLRRQMRRYRISV